MSKNQVVVSFRNIKKIYDKDVILKNINLDIYDQEFFTLLGPSGCGKTTLLRILGGFENITSGKLKLYDEDIFSSLPAYKRPINTVFQNYALFPHLSIYENIAYGLKMKKKSKSYINKKVKEMLNIVELVGKENKKPEQLSGGQKQRVALARALSNEPKVLLLDEPLSALDYNLRKQMQTQLKHIQKKVGITFIFVTHDQEEAMCMSDRIAVMHQGIIHQIGKPIEIYEHPINSFVGNFIGEINMFDDKSFWEKTNSGYKYKIDTNLYVEYDKKPNNMVVCIRPEKIVLSENKKVKGAKAVILKADYQGAYTIYLLQLINSQKKILVRTQNSKQNTYLKTGGEVKVIFPVEYVRVIQKV